MATLLQSKTKPDRFLVYLHPYRDELNHFVDPVDHATALLISGEVSRQLGILPWCGYDNSLLVAYTDSVPLEAESLLEGLNKTVMYTPTLPEELEYAQDRVFGLPKDLPDARLGGILFSMEKLHMNDLVGALQSQPISGGKIGSILSSLNVATHWDIAEALARQYGLPLVSLLANPHEVANEPSVAQIWQLHESSYWTRNLLVPLYMTGDTIVFATTDPSNQQEMKRIASGLNRKLCIVVTGYRDIFAVYRSHFGNEHELHSRQALVEALPEGSAHKRFSPGQLIFFTSLLLFLTLSIILFPLRTLITINVIFQCFYILNSIVRLQWILKSAHMPLELAVTEADIQNINRANLPIYTILVPLYKEASVLPTLKKALLEMDYPKDRLDVKFLLEADDVETIAAARDAGLPNYVDLVIVPSSEPKTKPKACNFGLHQARGDYVVIFDAEDIPERDQLLKAVSVFQESDERVACVQAKLSYYNGMQNVLTRWFTAEYAMWFDLLLPALFAENMPIPLGGTSNHFKIDVLRGIGAWDPYNVTEDADLGVRLNRAGYRTAIMNSTTHEEANSEFVNWVRQRSRWVKGYLQTWLVHMRHPVALWKDLGPKGFFGYQIIIGGTPMTFLLNPILWGLTSAWFLFQTPIAQELFPSWLYYMAFLNLLLGNFAFTYANITGMARRRAWNLVKYAALSPVYWTYMSIAAWKGAWQLITRPSYWEKTVHGLANKHDYTVLK